MTKLYFREDFADFRCEECGRTSTVCIKDETPKFIYCPWCGKRMGVEKTADWKNNRELNNED